MRALLAVATEGVHFLWTHRKATPEYVRWRLGTIYGSFDKASGGPRLMRELLRALWNDRRAVVSFLRWRRAVRRS